MSKLVQRERYILTTIRSTKSGSTTVEPMVRFPTIFTELSLTRSKVYSALGLSGEPMAAPVASFYETRKEQYTASQISQINILKRQYQKEYMEYWNKTSSLTGTGRPVDAIISPLAPFAAARPDMYEYVGTYLRGKAG
jgi:hypothetical protein